MIEVERPDALVSEIGLPDEDGYELIRQIRQHEAEHGGLLPAVALTGYARAEDRARVLAAGFQAACLEARRSSRPHNSGRDPDAPAAGQRTLTTALTARVAVTPSRRSDSCHSNGSSAGRVKAA